MTIGLKEGDVCNRDGCTGQIVAQEGFCSCQDSPPCSYCEEAPYYCDHCDVQIYDE